MILKIDENNESLKKATVEFLKNNPEVKIFYNELSAFADAEIDTRLDAIGCPITINEESKDKAIDALYEYLMDDETALNYNGMDDVVREVLGENLTFRMYLGLKFNRKPNFETDGLSIGSSELKIFEGKWNIDFENIEYGINKQDETVIEYVMKNPDTDTFECLSYITENELSNVSDIIELNYTTDSDDLELVEITHMTFILPYDDYKEIEVPSDVLLQYKKKELSGLQ